LKQINKHKIINDPVWGFISIAHPLIFKIIEHPYFQRLRRIKQLGLTELVYPGANHTRFAHALGAFFLMTKAIELLREKAVSITKAEEEAIYCGILLHDIGHGPFSHSLEFTLVKNIHHEKISLAIMNKLNLEFNGALDLTISIFLNTHPKRFLHQLISSQLDMDRLDYLSRDSFYTGVNEGIVGAERLIHMLNVANNELVIEEKGVYSVEKFLVARRLMYWQVYLHKTVVIADGMLQKIVARLSHLLNNKSITDTLPLHTFLKMQQDDEQAMLDEFLKLDDNDVYLVIKQGCYAEDLVLKMLCIQFLHRNLWEITLSNKKIPEQFMKSKHNALKEKYGFNDFDASFFSTQGTLFNDAYIQEGEDISILLKSGKIIDVAKASDNYNLDALKKKVTKYFVSWAS